jgi:hypothetical protein
MRVRKRNLLDGRIGAGFASKPRKKIKMRVIFGSFFLMVIPLLATTFASQVTIQGAHGGAIEFGQGDQKTIVCDQYIQTAIGESWNTSPASDFYVDKIFLTNLDVNNLNLDSATSNQGCGDKTLKVGLYNLSDTPVTIGADSSTSISFKVPHEDTSIFSLTGNSNEHGITASLVNSFETVTAVAVSETSRTYTYTPTTYAATYPLAIGDYVTISGTPKTNSDSVKGKCDYVGAHVSEVTTGEHSGTFTIDGLPLNDLCEAATGITAKVYGKGVIQLTLPASTIHLVATSVGRVSLESN